MYGDMYRMCYKTNYMKTRKIEKVKKFLINATNVKGYFSNVNVINTLSVCICTYTSDGHGHGL